MAKQRARSKPVPGNIGVKMLPVLSQQVRLLYQQFVHEDAGFSETESDLMIILRRVRRNRITNALDALKGAILDQIEIDQTPDDLRKRQGKRPPRSNPAPSQPGPDISQSGPAGSVMTGSAS